MVTVANKEAAKEISAALQEAFNSIGRSLHIAKAACTEPELKAYSDHVSDLFYVITFKLLEPLYHQHPDLRPDGWDDQPPMDPE
jgi:hypothetical protein